MRPPANPLRWFLALVGIAVAVRIGLWLTYEQVRLSDSQGYVSMADMLREGAFYRNEGARTPTYPALLAALGMNDRAVWIAQSLLGVGISALLFLGTWMATQDTRLGFALGAAHTLNLAQLYFEAAVMSETLATFLLVASVVLLGGVLLRGWRSPWVLAGLGLVTGALGLTRPLFLYLGLLYFIILIWASGGRAFWARVGGLAAFAAPAAVIVLGWSTVNYATTGFFGPTTLTGYNLINHTGKFIELAPDQYAVVKDIYLKYRSLRIAETGNQSMTVWEAYFPLIRATGLSYVGLSALLSKLSLDLILHHPILYLRSVLEAWIGFWKVPNYWVLAEVHPAALAPVLRIAWTLERFVLLGINAAFLALTLALGLRWLNKRRLEGGRLVALIGAVVWVGSLIQALADYGENPRYGVPFEPLIVWATALMLVQVAPWRSRTAVKGVAAVHV